jgi:hypothetical protein
MGAVGIDSVDADESSAETEAKRSATILRQLITGALALRQERTPSMSRLVLFVLLAVLAASPAYAYLDPGTGSILLQALLAGLAVGSATVAAFWTRIRQLFARRPRTDQPPADDDHDDARP